MKKLDRVIGSISGSKVDHVPSCFSLHFKRDRSFGEADVRSHLEFFEKTDTDVLKIMNENLVPYMGDIKTPADWKQIRNISLEEKFMVAQTGMVGKILDKCAGDSFIIGTIHGTVASGVHPIEAAYGYETVRSLMCSHIRENPEPIFDAFKRISEGMCLLSEKYIEMGLHAIYYAALGGETYYFTDEEFDKYIAPLDKMVLQAARDAGGYVFLHICKDKLNFKRYESYGALADVVNWGVHEENVSLDEGRVIFGDAAIMGGLQNRAGVLVDGTDEELAAEVRNVIQRQGKEKFILGADCTLATDTDYGRIRLMVDTARSI
ncbi:MAG: uroporphyrinogen decarboxylase family protein [Clostridia bacterium]